MLRKRTVAEQATTLELIGDTMNKMVMEVQSRPNVTIESVYKMPFKEIQQTLNDIKASFESICWKTQDMWR